MKIIGWTEWDNPKYKEMFSLGEKIDWNKLEKVKEIIAKELRDKGYKFAGDYHQNGYGVPVFDDGTVYQCTQRGWGGIMADAYPNEIDNSDGYGYCQWAWSPPEGQKSILPAIEDRIDYVEEDDKLDSELAEVMGILLDEFEDI